jgi:agmatinase
MSIDPNAKAASGAGIFGLPFKEKDAHVVYLPVPWDVTTSYLTGTHKGPRAIFDASEQIDFFDLDFGEAWKLGLYMRPSPKNITALNKQMRPHAEKIINASESQVKKSKSLQNTLAKVNAASEKLNQWVYNETKTLLKAGKMPILVGGDHSTPYGAIKAYAEEFPNLGILHFDAHSDTRFAYMGFEHSHASILYNVSKDMPKIKKFVQVGIRDFCQQEYDYTQQHNRFKVYFDRQLQQRLHQGENFASIAKEIVSQLPQDVYITIDIDGLDPRFCPHTGTPVPGGLDYHQFLTILRTLAESGKRLVGFDLVEVAPGPKDDEWDANVGMRVLYKLTACALATQKKIEIKKL